MLADYSFAPKNRIMIIRSATNYIKVTLIRNPANRNNDLGTLARCIYGQHPGKVSWELGPSNDFSRYFDFAG
jgi:hypothetical protein